MLKSIKRKISGFFQVVLDDHPWRVGDPTVPNAEVARQRARAVAQEHDRRVVKAHKYVADHPELFSPGKFR